MLKHSFPRETKETRGVYKCSRCTKQVYTYDEARVAKFEEERCEYQPMTPGMLTRLRLGKRFWQAELEDLEGTEHVSFLLRYCEKMREMREGGYGLVLWGDFSSGKTHTAAVLLKEAKRCKFSGMFMSMGEYMEATLKDWGFEEDQSFVERAREVDFLVIDDVGKEYGKKGNEEWGRILLDQLLRGRSNNLLCTIFTTNMTLEKFKERVGVSVVELARGSMHLLRVVGSNKRAGGVGQMLDTLGVEATEQT